MDLTKLSDSDLKAIADGDLESLSTEALQMLAGGVEPAEKPSIIDRLKGTFAFEPFTREMAGGMFEEPALGVAQLVSRAFGVGEESVDRMIQEREQRIRATPGGEAGRIAGIVASPATALFAGNLPSLIRQIPRAM